MNKKLYKLLNVECKFPLLTDTRARDNVSKFNNSVKDDDLRHSIVLCINKKNVAKIQRLENDIAEYVKDNNIKNPNIACLVDGDNKYKSNREQDFNFIGYMVLTAKNKGFLISIVDKDRNDIDGSKINSGYIVNAVISFYQYTIKNEVKTYCELHKIQLLDDRPAPMIDCDFTEEDSKISKVDPDDPF